MTQVYQNILLVDHIPEAVDSIINTFNDADLPPVKISTAYSLSYALELLNENEFSLLIVGLEDQTSFDDFKLLTQLHQPKPTIAILPESLETEIIPTLRCGAADVFIRGAECFVKGDFAQSIIDQLHKAELIEKNAHYQR